MIYRHLKGYKYELMGFTKIITAFSYKLEVKTKYITIHHGILTIHKHYAWDGASGAFTIDTKTFMRGSLVHDACYQLIREGHLPRIPARKHADQLLKQICLQAGMNKFRAWYVYKAVRMFGKKSSMPRKKPRGKLVEI